MVKDKKEIKAQNNKVRSSAEQHSNSITGSFLSILCHQFRSSLNIIAFSNSLLKRNILQQEAQFAEDNISFSNNIQSGVEELSQLLDELIFYGRLEVKEVKFKPDLIDINLFCNEIISQMNAIAIDKKQTINFIKNCSYQKANLDKKLLQPVLVNLISNAIKYSSENSAIDFKLNFQEEKIIFQVKDRGIGIPENDLPRLFEPFFRGSNAGEAKGRGLGLAIVKNLVEIQEGAIEVESEIGIGTTFTVTMSTIRQTLN